MTAIIFLILRILLSLALYSLLFLLFFFLWKENRKTGISILQSKVPPITLNQISEGDTEKIRVFYSDEFTIGRSANCEWQLPDEVVSNFHARFSYHHMQWWIEDLKSKNGTFINGNNVATPTVLTSGDVISIGDDLFELSIFNDGDQEEVITNKISDGDLDE